MLLNLISNGFYATIEARRRGERRAYEPMLAASTKNLGDSVEIRIRDNGTGIPPEVKEKMFNPFFTTKPAGEGTGLGLSLSHDIVVKQHAGTIEVDTEPGEFTEFRIVLPRGAASLGKIGRRSMSLLILVVDDEPDVEALFRQQFRRDHPRRPLRHGVRAVGAEALARIERRRRRDADPDPLRHQHAGHERAGAAAARRRPRAPTCRSS